MSSTPTNPFIDDYLPNLFWPAQIATFGSQVAYLPGGDSAAQVNLAVLWVDGASDEDISPGRYSHIKVKNSDLAQPPALGDIVQTAQARFQVVVVSALTIGFSILVLQEAGAVP
jgi:hypothetical protein